MRFIGFLLLALAPLTAHAEFGLHTGAYVEIGSMGSATADIYESRSMGAFGLQAMPGYRTMGKALLLGLMFNLRFFSQLSEGTATDYSGTNLLIGPAAALEFTKIKALLGWDIRARHSAKLNTSLSGSGLRFLLGYRLSPFMSVDALYTKTRYNSRSNGTLDIDLSESPIKASTFGLGVSLSY
jgi:hypothetical protein